MQQPATLAKLNPPRISRVYPRARLFKQLDEACKKPVVWISAPAGSGKTVLTASYLQQKKIKPLWYQVDEGDADLASFFYYLGLLGKQAAPRRKKQLPHLTPEYLSGLPIFTRNFFRELFARIKTPGVLVFDNFQNAGNDIPLHQILPIAMSEIPDSLNVVIVSRSEPPASLSRLRASKQVAVLEWSDLRLTEEEGIGVGTLWTKSNQVDETLYRELTILADGWVTGLVLYLEHAAGTAIPDAIKQQDSQKAVFDYFAGEILNKVEDDARSLLLKTAFLPKISVNAAQQLSGKAGADEILEDLTSRNYFTVHHATKIPAYEFHPLFREFLQDRAHQVFTSEELKKLLSQSAAILVDEGHMEHALELLREVHNWQVASQLILQHAQAYVEQGRGATVLQWIKWFPESELQSNIWLKFWLGVSQLPYALPAARTILEDVYTQFKEQGDVVGIYSSWCSVIDTYVQQWADFTPLDPWIAELEPLQERYPEFPTPELGARVAIAMFTALIYRQPHHARLPEWEQQVHTLVLNNTDARFRIFAGNQLLLYHTWWTGDLAKAELLVDLLRPVASTKIEDPMVLIGWYTVTAAFYWMRADNEGCIEAVNAGLTKGEFTGVHLWDALLLSIGCYAARSTGDLVRSQVFADKMAAVLNHSRPLDVVFYHYIVSWNALLRGDHASAIEHGELGWQGGVKGGAPLPQSVATLGLAKVLLRNGDYARAAELIDEAHRIADRMHSGTVKYLAYVAQAENAFYQGDEIGGIAALRLGLERMRRHGFMNDIWWWPSIMTELCVKAIQHDIEVPYVQALIRRRNLLPPNDSPVPDAWPFPVKVYTLGRFSLLIDDEPVIFKGKAPKKSLELLKTLIAFGGREVSIEKITDALWPDAEGDAAYQSFTMALQRLRKLLVYNEALLLAEGKLTLDARYIWVDVWAFERGLSSPTQQEAGKALTLYKGHFLQTEPETARMLSLREHLLHRYLHAVEKHGAYLEQSGQPEQAISIYEQGLEVDPLAEDYYKSLMRCQSDLGRRSEALRTYERCKDALKDYLEVAPTRQTQALYHALLEKDELPTD